LHAAGPADEDEENGLEGVVGVVIIAENAAADAEDHRAVATEKGLEGTLVAAAVEAAEQLGVVRIDTAGELASETLQRGLSHDGRPCRGTGDCHHYTARPHVCSFKKRRTAIPILFASTPETQEASPLRSFSSLSEREILALAISLEEEDGRIYGDFAEAIRADYPSTAAALVQMREEEDNHRRRLIEMYRSKFGEHIPLIRRHDVKGFVHRKPVWLVRPLGVEHVRRQTELMELETTRFYERALEKSTDAGIRQLLGDLAEEERKHSHLAEELETAHHASGAAEEEAATRHRLFVLQVIQPGLAGLMDGSVSTLAPLFAAAFATHSSFQTFLVGLAASLGAGISMGFAEALSDDGSLTGRGKPLMRGLVCGLMTALGGLGHTLPYLWPDVHVATGIAIGVVFVELGVISWVRHRYMDTPWSSAVFQVVVGGVLVFLTGVLIGSRD
jgi:rubrerythrin